MSGSEDSSVTHGRVQSLPRPPISCQLQRRLSLLLFATRLPPLSQLRRPFVVSSFTYHQLPVLEPSLVWTVGKNESVNDGSTKTQRRPDICVNEISDPNYLSFSILLWCWYRVYIFVMSILHVLFVLVFLGFTDTLSLVT